MTNQQVKDKFNRKFELEYLMDERELEEHEYTEYDCITSELEDECTARSLANIDALHAAVF